MKNKPVIAYIELSFAMVMVGSFVVVSKLITTDFPIFIAAALRFAIASLIMLPLLVRSGQGIRTMGYRALGVLFLQSFMGNFLFSIFLLLGLRYTSASQGGIILGTVPVMIGLISFIFLHEPPAWNKILALLIATGGVILVSSQDAPLGEQGANPLLGNIILFGAVIGEALWTILGKSVSARVSPLAIASLTSLFGFILFTPLAVYQVLNVNLGSIPAPAWVAVIFYGVATVFTYVSWYRGVSKVPASTAGVFAGVQPVSTALLSVLILSERLSWAYLGGIVAILAGIFLMGRSVRRQAPAEAEVVVSSS